MAILTEFTIFSALPTELRLRIWERVPQPERVLGQLPCSKCWKSQQTHRDWRRVRTGCDAHVQHPDWCLRWIGNNQDEAIFPPLHACRESRAAWLPRYFSPPRYLDLPHDNMQHCEVSRLRFDIPFVSYETDVFAIFDTGISFLGFDVDPFLGFDRQRIQKVAISENAWSLMKTMVAIKPQSLPVLSIMSVLVLGPDPDIDDLDMDGYADPGWQEMPAVDIQHVACDVRDVSDKLIVKHPLFGRSRLRQPVFVPGPKMRQLANYLTFFKAWLWHGSHWDNHEDLIPTDMLWWDFYCYLTEENVFDECPLGILPGWCPGHHTKDEILNWSSAFTVDIKFLVEKRCMVELTSASALELDPTGNYDRFVQFKERRIADFKTRKALE